MQLSDCCTESQGLLDWQETDVKTAHSVNQSARSHHIHAITGIIYGGNAVSDMFVFEFTAPVLQDFYKIAESLILFLIFFFIDQSQVTENTLHFYMFYSTDFADFICIGGGRLFT